MRLPGRVLLEADVRPLAIGPVKLVGCLGFEERSIAVPLIFWTALRQEASFNLLELEDPADGVPDYSKEREAKVQSHRSRLQDAGLQWISVASRVMASEDDLLSIFDAIDVRTGQTVVLDITALPKRYFCFLLRRLAMSEVVENILVTYTEAGDEGYTAQHLAEDVMSPDTFPGFAGSTRSDETELVISVGFEALGLRSLIVSLQREVQRDLRVILPFPAQIETVRRQWNTLREITENDPKNLRMRNVATVAAWDAELAYETLTGWASEDVILSLAPFGPKPHTLAMALFAIKHDASLWYTQPKAYHYNYTRGIGITWWYAVKWRGIICFDRKV
jgi:hypothetical protein